jgi:hypothetical protein
MNITYQELKEIETAAYLAGADAALEEVCRALPAMLDHAVKVAMEARKARPSKPAYPSRSARKSTLRPVN